MPRRRSRNAVSFIEILIAMFIIAGLGVTVQGMMISTVQGIGVDRVTEAKRQMVLDLLERFCHPYSDLEAIFSAGGPPVPLGTDAHRKLTLDEAIAVVAIPGRQAAVTRAILASGFIEGFTLTWTKGMVVGKGNPDLALRVDMLWVFPVQTKDVRGALVSSFRTFYTRGR